MLDSFGHVRATLLRWGMRTSSICYFKARALCNLHKMKRYNSRHQTCSFALYGSEKLNNLVKRGTTVAEKRISDFLFDLEMEREIKAAPFPSTTVSNSLAFSVTCRHPLKTVLLKRPKFYDAKVKIVITAFTSEHAREHPRDVASAAACVWPGPSHHDSTMLRLMFPIDFQTAKRGIKNHY